MNQKRVQRPIDNDSTNKNAAIGVDNVEVPEIETILAKLNSASKQVAKAKMRTQKKKIVKQQLGCCM